MEIKAIETRYKGYRFRSRLEARWAVFFDALGWNWEYEREGFELPRIVVDEAYTRMFLQQTASKFAKYLGDPRISWTGGARMDRRIVACRELVEACAKPSRYLPDFWFPDLCMWGEVKPSREMSMNDVSKLVRFIASQQTILLLFGDLSSPIEILGKQCGYIKSSEKDGKLERAVIAAKSARFEHGESPRIHA